MSVSRESCVDRPLLLHCRSTPLPLASLFPVLQDASSSTEIDERPYAAKEPANRDT
jgi:hypothetical protein